MSDERQPLVRRGLLPIGIAALAVGIASSTIVFVGQSVIRSETEFATRPLVERLRADRHGAEANRLAREAANEIGRLETVIEQLRAELADEAAAE